MLRPLLSIVGGLVIAFAVVFLTDTLFHATSSAAAAPTDMNDREAMRAYVARQPPALLLALVAGWAAAAFAGAAVAARYGQRGAWPGWVVGGLFLLATAANFLMVPHPVWMVVTGIVAIPIAAWFGASTGTRPVQRRH